VELSDDPTPPQHQPPRKRQKTDPGCQIISEVSGGLLGVDSMAIKHERGFLGPHSPILKVGDVQTMCFKEGDVGPFWMSEAEREEKRFDKTVDGQTKTRQFTKDELVKQLKEKGITAKGKKEAIQRMAQEQGLPIEETKAKIIEGWEGKPKGLLQVLWERGLIDPNNIGNYTVEGRQDAFGVVQKAFSLKHLMANCQDFEEEETLLQSMGREMGVLVDRSPKCHCELAGEGIEYTWGCMKNTYRRVALKRKRGKENFYKVVDECLSRENVLTIERIRTFARRARA